MRTAPLVVALSAVLAVPALPAASAPPVEPGGVIVQWAPGTGPTARAEALARAGARARADLPLARTQVLRADRPGDAVARLLADPRVEWAEPDRVLEPASADPGFFVQWGLENTGGVFSGRTGVPGVDVQAPEAWAATAGAGGAPVLVAVVDSGVDLDHPDLAAAVYRDPDEVPGNGVDDDGNGFVDDVSGWDFVGDDPQVGDDRVVDEHGTHVAGTVAAVRDNGVGVAGVTERARLLPVQFLGPDGGLTSDAVRAVDYARRQGAKVITASFGGPDASRALDEAIAASGAVLVAAAGNEGRNTDLEPSYPASSTVPEVLSVAAVANDGSLPVFSNRGLLTVDVGAPGVDIVSTVPGDYAALSGTSMAAPHAAGVAAMVRSLRPDLSAAQTASLVAQTVRPLASLQGTTRTGGMVDALAAVRAALAGVTPTPLPGTSTALPGSDGTVAPERACPDGIPAAGFDDTAGSVHRYAIDCVVWYGLAQGTSPTTYSPDQLLTRGQAASLLAALVAREGRLPTEAPDAFTDDDDSVHEPQIDRLAALGVLDGTSATTFSPDRPVSRGQAASLVVRVHELLTGSPLPRRPSPFLDVLGTVHQEAVEKAYAAGLVGGTSATTYGPEAGTTRGQAASLVARDLQALAQAGVLDPRR